MIDNPQAASERALIKAAVEHSLRGESSYRLLVPGSDPEVWVEFGSVLALNAMSQSMLIEMLDAKLEEAAAICDAKVAQLKKLGAQQNQIGTAQILAESIRELKGKQ